MATEERVLKAPAAEQLQLLQLQAIDTKIDQLNHRERSLPESKTLAGLDALLANLRDDAVTAQTQVTDLSRSVTRAEGEVEQVRARARKDQQLMDSGSIKSSKQLEDLQHEIESLKRRQAELEDAELEVMEAAEEAQNAVDALTASITEAETEQAALKVSRDAAVEQISGERDASRADRADVVARISAELLDLYEKIRADQGGVGAAPLRGARCEGCHMQIPPNELAAVVAAPADDVQRCDNCRRILVRTEASAS